MTLEQHIEELRAELRHGSRKEHRRIERELKGACEELARRLARKPR